MAQQQATKLAKLGVALDKVLEVHKKMRVDWLQVFLAVADWSGNTMPAQVDLMKATQLSHSALNRALNFLESGYTHGSGRWVEGVDLIQAAIDPRHAQRKLFKLTPKGVTLARKIDAVMRL